MDGQVEEEDSYSDDDLDALPDNAFTQLEEHAFQSTQHLQPSQQAPLPAFKSPHRLHGAAMDGGFGRLTVNGAADLGNARGSASHALSSDYGDFDDEMLDGEIYDANEQPSLAATIQRDQNQNSLQPPGESTQREQWRQQRFSRPANTAVRPQPQPNDLYASRRPVASDSRNRTKPAIETAPTEEEEDEAEDAPNSNIAALQAEIQSLLRERIGLEKAAESANDQAFAKAGEIAIVRANASKLEKEYDGRVKDSQQRHAVEAARLQKELEDLRDQLKRLSTEKEFLEKDVAEGTVKIRSLQRDAQRAAARSEVTGTKANGKVSPKRQRRSGLADGFDDEDIMPMSPSKLVHRTKGGTPKAGSKRKRKAADDSPTKRSLEFDQPINVDSFDESSDSRKQIPGRPPMPKPANQNFPFLQKFLDHRFPGAEQRTIEAFAAYKLPSLPSKPLSTILLDKISPLRIRPDTENLPAAIALEVISIWAQCMQEHYHDPIHLLISQIKFILTISPLKTAPELTNNLMSLLQETADILIIPRCQKKPPRDDRALITSTATLALIHQMATQLSPSEEESTRFWRTMRFDFIMMLLSFIHPLSELHLMLRLLAHSILPNSFAMIIPPNDGIQSATEARVIDNLSRLLVEPPRPTQGEPSLTGIELAELRLNVLSLLEEMAGNDYAALALSKHKLVLGRLVRLMNDSLANAYDYTSAHPYLIELVNSGTRLLYYFLNNFPEQINIQDKLRVIPGGEKKFLIVLTRLAFSEGIFLEEGIEDDVVDLAHRMLEERVTPEEAGGLMGVMSSEPSSRAPTTRRESRDDEAMAVEDENDDEEGDDGGEVALEDRELTPEDYDYSTL